MDLSELLRDRGMRVTSQRLLIERALREHGGHLTAEQVHDLVEPALPGVTQQTVYSTLALLADRGLPSPHGLRALRGDRGPARARAARRGHPRVARVRLRTGQRRRHGARA